jgi:signal transduction histidine kinase
MTEHALFSFGDGIRADIPVAPEVLAPRLGEHLVEKGVITEDQLKLALNHQKEEAARGNPVLLGHALIWLGIIDQIMLDKAITEQIFTLQDALRRANRELEDRVQARTQDLQHALSRLTELNQLKANIIANISHELRTPLTHIKGYTELMLDGSLGELSESQLDAIQVMGRSSKRLERLINDLIRFSSSARGDIALNLTQNLPSELVSAAWERSLRKAQAKELEIKRTVETNLPEVVADEENIQWVLQQLLDNAIKFTSKGGKVSIQARKDGDLVRFSVIDNGIGIPKEHVQHIFDAFHQLDGSSTRRYEGTGLGLALAKRILDAHNAEIKVDSVVGKGTRFTFFLPIANSSPAEPDQDPQPGAAE